MADEPIGDGGSRGGIQPARVGGAYASHRAVAVLATVLLVVAGCMTTASPPPARSPTSPPAAETPSPAATPPPTILLTERDRSDRFWSRVIDYEDPRNTLHTLEQVVVGSDLIVLGRIVRRETTGCPAEATPAPARPDICEDRTSTFAVVAVDAVLMSDGQVASGTVMVKFLGLAGIPESEWPGGELVLFLRNYGEAYTESGYPQPSDSPRWQWYFPVTNFQGVLRNLDGVVDVPEAPDGWWDDVGPFPGDVDGQPFDAVVGRIREVVGP